MSSHRAQKRHASMRHLSMRGASGPGATAGGRRRATPRRRHVGVAAATLTKGAALVAVGVVVATAGHLISAEGQPPTSAQAATGGSDGSGAALSSLSLVGRDAAFSAGRGAPQVSRSGSRPKAPPAATSGSAAGVDSARVGAAARQQVALRSQRLRAAASDAKTYASHLANEQARIAASSGWVLPTSGFHITVWFGEAGPYWSSGYHTGIDFATAYGTPVVAVADATVAQAGWDGAYGNQIRLQFENGDQVWYNHLSAIEVGVGDTVARGQELGRIGETGNAYGAHLHFEYRLATDLSTAVDPRPFFAEHGITLS